MSEIPIKTAVNTRASLVSRLPKKPADVPVAASIALHRKAETTYDVTYAAGPRAASFCSLITTSTAEEIEQFSGGETAAAALHSDAQGNPAVTQTYILSRDKPSEWESVAHAATRNVEPDKRLNFFASARKIEQADDDRRGGTVGRMQRSLDIRTKRADDASLRPPTPTFQPSEVQPVPKALTQERYGAKSNYLDLVECTQMKPNTEEQYTYDKAPLTRLPGDTLSQELTVQSKVITEMATSRELFRGTPKFLKDVSVSYTGHVPMADRNVACMHHGDDPRRLFAKSTMTMAEHGGGVDLAVIGANLAARHRAGKNAKAPQMLKPRTAETISQTLEGRMLRQPFCETLERERTMNIRDEAQGQNYF